MQILGLTLIIVATMLGVSAMQWQYLNNLWMTPKLFHQVFNSDQERNIEAQEKHYEILNRPKWLPTKLNKPSNFVSKRLKLDEEKKPGVHLNKYLVPTTARMPISERQIKQLDALKFWKPCWRDLLQQLYGDQPFYQDLIFSNKDAGVDLLISAVKRLNELKKEKPNLPETSYSVELIKFEDPYLQEAWYHMLKGSDRNGLCYPSLLRYFFFSDVFSSDELNQVSLTYASSKVLKAFLGKELATRFIQRRNEILESNKGEDDLEQGRQIVLKKKNQDELLLEIAKDLGVNLDPLRSKIDTRINITKVPKESLLESSSVKEEGAWDLL
jgi:hypothetical protein